MKRITHSIFIIIIALLVIGCNEEDFGYTKEEIFKSAYEHNFVKAFGAIAEDETWDFSQYGNRPAHSSQTRADGLAEAETGWYRVDQSLLDSFFKGTLAEGRNNSGSGENFCFMAGSDNFSLIPIYKGSTTQTWTLYMKVYTPDATSGTEYKVWSNADNAIKIQNPGCNTCGGTGRVSSAENGTVAECKTCNNTGKVISPFCLICKTDQYYNATTQTCTNCGGIFKPCQTCNGSGTVTTNTCPECANSGAKIPGTDQDMPKGKVVCTDCGGRGFTDKNGGKPYTACTKCGGEGSTNAYGQAKKDPGAQGGNGKQYKRGTKIMDCPICKGTGKDSHTECHECHGGKYYVTCPVCRGQEVYLCNDCNGTGLVTTGWKTLPNNSESYKNSTFGAYAIEGKPITISEITDKAIVPTGSLFFFYLVSGTGSTTKTSLEGSMKLFTPTNLAAGSDVKLIACEEGDAVADHNDLVFLIQGKPTAIYTKPETSFTTLIKKRYMCEDLGSYRDWDFNDLVIDVTRSNEQKLSGSGKNLTKTVATSKTYASVYELLGTLPISFSIGSNQFPATIDPTRPFETVKMITGDNSLTATDVAPYQEGTPWTDACLTMQAPSWNPDENKISVTVTMDGSKTNDGVVWTTQFPRAGGIPYIIATDQTDAPTTECQDIREMQWFMTKFK